MQSFENKPPNEAQRPGASLNVDTGYKKKPKPSSPPRTPNTSSTRIGKGNVTVAGRALRIRTAPRETFLDDITPIDAGKYNALDTMADDRDSHDLSLSPRQVTRDSLVDHMLSSLDQLDFVQEAGTSRAPLPANNEAQLHSAFVEEGHYSTYTATRNGRAPGHGHSYSSDYESQGTTTQSSSQLTRGRRSNSSSNFQTGLARLNSLRIEANGSSSGTVLRPTQTQSRALHSRGGKGSKGSSANSLDLGYAQVTSNQRWTHGIGGRSSSFDFGQDRQTMSRQINTAAPAFSPCDYDAAPTPTVPVGPRRQQLISPVSSNLALHPEIMPAPPIPKTVERKISTRSSKSAYKSAADGVNGLGISLNHGTNENGRELPPISAFVKEAAPAPLVGYGKSKEPLQGTQIQGSVPQTKDRPGFFRRVFGSSRNNHAPAPEPHPSHGSTASTEPADRPGSKPQHIASQMKAQHPPTREPPPAPKDHPHVLTRRPSSFFRRRKKSISEPTAPPPLPAPAIAPPVLQAQLRKEDLTLKPLPSPISSLRKVMNPYLKGSIKSPMEPDDGLDGHSDESRGLEDDLKTFSPGYNPDANATIRTVKPESREGVEASIPPPRSAPLKTHLDVDSAISRTPNSSSSPRRELQDETFLQDSSDNDPDGQSNISRSPSPSKEVFEKRMASPVPPASIRSSVARDMALVAEYERVYSKRSPTPAKASTSVSNESLASPVGSYSSKVKAAVHIKEEEWVMLTPTKSPSDKENRVWLEPTSSEEDLAPTSNLSLPLDGARASVRTSGSTSTAYKSATSLPAALGDGDDEPQASPLLLTAVEAIKALDNLQVTPPNPGEPTDGDRERAKKIYDGNEDFIQKARAASWLGEEGVVRQRTLVAYMELYDFANLNVLAALRMLCSKLVLKGESQQVDRILDGFAKRWCQCNPNHGFKIADVVHTICYSLLLLNTDLHLADIEYKMTRSQFVKNTTSTILRVVADSAPDSFEPNRPSTLPQKSHDGDLLSPTFKPSDEQLAKDADRPSWRTSMRPPFRTDSDGQAPTPLNYNTAVDDCGPLVKAPFHGTLRTWEVQVEIVLKDFYASIRSERLPLFGAPIEKPQPQQPSQSSLSVFTSGMLRRTPSVLSKTPSEAVNNRGRTADSVRLGTGRWTSKNRSRPRVYPNSGVGSSRTSLDDQSSMWSPSVSSSTWSKYSLGKTQTSMSVNSVGSSWPQGDYQQSIGFANALSQAIIREEHIGSAGSNGSEELRVAPLLEDESLELAGAPWAKEGLVKHKHHLEAVDKKAKDRNWNETFAVIEKGYMSLFSFSSKSMRNKSKGKAPGGVVGGGNWQDNAENLGSFLLRQTIASALPPPGYSKARPHVWALSLPTGAVHLFQVGTPEIVREFVSTANYWSARLSNHPLVGGISNIEYGWTDAIINNSLVMAINEGTRPSSAGPRPSLQSSLRSSLDQGANAFRSRLPGDKVTISEWTPPTQSMRASNLMERDQLHSLVTYVHGVEDELQRHNQLRSSMLLAFTPRQVNAQKAMANWEKKSSYLLREIVKFRTYIDCLQNAETQKQKFYAERAAEKVLREKEDEEGEGDSTLRPE